MGKLIVKQAGSAAVQSVLRTLMPEIDKRLELIEHRLNVIDGKIDGVRQEISDRYEQTRDVINELGQRMARVEGKFEELTRGLDRQTDKMDDWIERLVQVEMSQTSRKRRAG